MNDLLFGSRVLIVGNEIRGTIISRSFAAYGMQKMYLVELDEPFWNEGKTVFVTCLVCHEDNLAIE